MKDEEYMGLTPEEYEEYEKLRKEFRIIIKFGNKNAKEVIYKAIAKYVNDYFGEPVLVRTDVPFEK